jgi:hypothetical protein
VQSPTLDDLLHGSEGELYFQFEEAADTLAHDPVGTSRGPHEDAEPIGREESPARLAEEPSPVRSTEQVSRLEKALEAVRESGFPSLDGFVAEYYTAGLGGATKLASSRRLDRNRKLPLLLSRLRESAPSWTEWEARGYRDETLRAAESILQRERTRLSEGTELRELLESSETVDLSPEFLDGVSHIFQDQVRLQLSSCAMCRRPDKTLFVFFIFC